MTRRFRSLSRAPGFFKTHFRHIFLIQGDEDINKVILSRTRKLFLDEIVGPSYYRDGVPSSYSKAFSTITKALMFCK